MYAALNDSHAKLRKSCTGVNFLADHELKGSVYIQSPLFVASACVGILWGKIFKVEGEGA